MRNMPLHTTLACFVVACGLVTAPASKASNLDLVNGASCQLSIPTTATGVRPKASGFRNESTTTSSFVICTMSRSTTTGEYSQVGLIGYSVPIFWLGLLALLVFYARLGWVSGPGRIDVVFEYTFTPVTGFFLIDAIFNRDWAAFRDILSHIILPASLLGYFSMAYISRMTRSFMLNELGQEYIVAARAKGLSERRIIWVHALRNAAVPLFTVIALSYMHLLEGSVLTETIFAWPGLGRYLTNALLNADMNAVLGGTLVVGVVFIAVNLLTDIIGRLADPRVR